jgi:hypothetical protein
VQDPAFWLSCVGNYSAPIAAANTLRLSALSTLDTIQALLNAKWLLSWEVGAEETGQRPAQRSLRHPFNTDVMGKKKRIRSQNHVVISEEPPIVYTMDSHSSSSSQTEHVSGAASLHELSSFADLPELDDGLSSGGYSSEYLSTGDASLVDPDMELDEGMGHMEVDEEVNEGAHGGGVDGVSLYTPSHYRPVHPLHQQPMRPFDDGATV